MITSKKAPLTAYRKGRFFTKNQILLGLLADVGKDTAVHIENVPLTKLEASEAKNTAGPTRSSVSPQRPAGVLETMNWSKG